MQNDVNNVNDATCATSIGEKYVRQPSTVMHSNQNLQTVKSQLVIFSVMSKITDSSSPKHQHILKCVVPYNVANNW